jgi:branched-chain amino acid transport system ATP-binding protein
VPRVPTGEENEGVLAVSDVSVSFGGITALDSVSLEVSRGEVLGIIGPNGAGKTTLFNVICGFVRPAAGTLHWRGQPLLRIAPHRLASLGIARTLQGVGLFPHLTVLENVMVGARRASTPGFASAILGLPRSDRYERALKAEVMEHLRQLGIEDCANRYPVTLPYGVQKWVALARALVSRPALLLLDEPASGLSANEQKQLITLLRSLRDRMSIALVEHRLDLVMTVCEHIHVLDFGRLIASGSPDEVQNNKAVTDAYLGTELKEERGPHQEGTS